MSATTELITKLKSAIRGEGEPGHPGEMISVVEAEYLIDEVFAEAEAAPSDTERVPLAKTIMDALDSLWVSDDRVLGKLHARDEILAAIVSEPSTPEQETP